MSTYIEIPPANRENIAIFPDEPGDEIIEEIKLHVRTTSSPHTWRGHTHTLPPKGSFVVYVDEFDVPAPPKVRTVAPCPCCNPNHPQYKNNGKIAWFPNEAVIRLIGPDCFAALDATGHEEALIALRRRQKVKRELDIIRLHFPHLGTVIELIDQASKTAEALNTLKRRLGLIFSGELKLNLWREVKDGILALNEVRRVPFRKPDGTIGERDEEIRTTYARIVGAEMLSQFDYIPIEKLKAFRARYVKLAARLKDVSNLRDLGLEERQKTTDALTRGRAELSQILDAIEKQQRFLTSGALEMLEQWGKHPDSPLKFNLRREGRKITISSATHSRGKRASFTVDINPESSTPVGKLPELRPPK